MSFLGLAQTAFGALLPPLYVTSLSTNPSGPSVTMMWDPSPDGSVTGYFLCWGLVSGQCTNQMDVGATTKATVGGFSTNVVYYFNVVAYDNFGQKADPSNEVQCGVSSASSGSVPLSIQSTQTGGKPTSFSLSFQGITGRTYTLLATQDFVTWSTVWTTNCLTDGAVTVPSFDFRNYSRRFYRLLEVPQFFSEQATPLESSSL